MRVFISADMEGTAGVTDSDQTREGRPDYTRFRRLMTEEVNAAILGALEAGAKEIVVNDGSVPESDSGNNSFTIK